MLTLYMHELKTDVTFHKNPVTYTYVRIDPELLNSHWLVDGFPRTIRQSESLLEQHKPDIVLNLDVPFDEIINRVKGMVSA